MALSNAQYDSLMRTYESARRSSRMDLESRREMVYERIPAYRALDDEVITLSADTATGVIKSGLLKDPSSDKELRALSERLKAIREEKKDLLVSNGFDVDFLAPRHTCPLCEDTGYVDGERCRCFNEKAKELLYQQSNLRKLTEMNNFSRLSEEYYEGEDLKRFRAAVSICRRMIQGFSTPEGFENILFYGTVGSGKSFLSIATANEILKNGHSVLYFSSGELFDRMADATFGYEGRDALSSLRGDLLNCELLVIDDLGAELTNAFVSSQLFTVINERELRRNATMISTNLNPEEIRSRYSDRVFSRLMSYYTICELHSKDVRLMRKAR